MSSTEIPEVKFFSSLQDVLLSSLSAGDIVIYNGTRWVNIPAGYTGEFLQTEGNDAAPQWSSMAAGKATNLTGGNNTTLLGAIPYQSDVDITTLLSPNTTTTKKFMAMTGDGANGAVPSWSTVTKTDVGLSSVTNVAQMPSSYLDTDVTLAANSDSKVASQKAIKSYADQLIAANNALVYKGVIDCSENPNYPAASVGWTYIVSVDGKIGGVSGKSVKTGNMIICVISNSGGTQASVGLDFDVISANGTGNVAGPTSSTDGNLPLFDGTTGVLIKNSTYSPSSFQTAASNLTSLTGLSYASTSFVKMTGANSFALDTATYLTGNQSISLGGDLSGSGTTSISGTVTGIQNKSITLATGFLKYSGSAWGFDNSTYLTSLSGAILTDQTSGQTIGDTDHRLTKLWATDITCTNTISGNAATVTNATLTTALTVNTGAVTLTGASGGSTLMIGTTASISGNNTGDQTNVLGYAATLKSPSTTGTVAITGMGVGATRTKTVRDTDDTLLELGGSYTPTGTWIWTSATVTWPTFNQSTTGSAGKSTNLIGGNSITLLGSIPYQSDTDITSFVSPNVTNTRKFLRMIGNNSNGTIPVWDTVSASDVGLGSVTNAAQVPMSYLDTDSTFAANSDTKVASQKATKSYVDHSLSTSNALVFKGTIDCSINPNYPASSPGWLYLVSVSGKIGGSSGVSANSGDQIICITVNSGGDQAAVGVDFNVISVNETGVIIGPASSTDGNFPLFNGTTGVMIKNSTYSPSSFQASNSNLSSLAGLSYSSGSFVKMTDTNTFTLDTNTYLTSNQSISLGGDLSGSGTTSISGTVTGIRGLSITLATGFLKYSGSAWTFDNSTYLTSLSGAVLTNQSSPQTIGDTDHRLTKLWATDIACTNTISGSVTGSAGKSTNLIGGNSTTLLGSIPYQSDTDTTTLLTPNTTSTKKFFRMTGNGTNGAAPVWDTVTNTDVGLSNVTNVAQLPASYLDTDATLDANSDSKVASQKATKAYADQLLVANNAMVYKGAIDCSTNPNYPKASVGWAYTISVSGKIGGVSGEAVTTGDMVICTFANNGGDEATVGADFDVIAVNNNGMVVGPISSTDGYFPLFNGTTGVLIKNSTYSPSSFQTSNSNLSSLASLSYVSGSFVKMTGANTFTLDTNTYLTSLSGAVLTDQTSGQTIGATGSRLTKLWATDITCTNTISGSVSGSAGSVSNATFTTALTVNTGSVTLTGNSGGSTLTLGAGSSSVSGTNTGDQTNISGYAVTLKSPSTTGTVSVTGMGASTSRTKTVRDADDTILELGGSYSPTGTWNWVSGSPSVTWPTFNQSTTGTANKATNLVGGDTHAMYGSIPYQNGTNSTVLLSPNVATTRLFLLSSGDSVNGLAPIWDTVTKTDVGLSNVTNDAQIKASIGTTKGDLITFSASATPVRIAAGSTAGNLRTDGSGGWSIDTSTYLTSVTAHNLLSTTHGDTLAGSVVRGDVLIGNDTPKWSRLAFPSTPTGKVLQATATDVVWSTNPITIGASASVSGSNTGDQTITLTSDVTGSGTTSITTTIANAAVTYAKIQNVSATSKILGRKTTGAGSIEELSGSDVKTILAISQADVSGLTISSSPSFVALSASGSNGLTLGSINLIGGSNIPGKISFYTAGTGNTHTTTITAGTNTGDTTITLPAANPAATYLLNMTSGGSIGYDTNSYLSGTRYISTVAGPATGGTYYKGDECVDTYNACWLYNGTAWTQETPGQGAILPTLTPNDGILLTKIACPVETTNKTFLDGQQHWSVSGWFNLTAPITCAGFFGNTATSNPGHSVFLVYSDEDSAIHMQVSGPGNTPTTTLDGTGGSLTTGVWMHIEAAKTVIGGQGYLKVWINGVEKGSATITDSQAFDTMNRPFSIGGYLSVPSATIDIMSCMIDEVVIRRNVIRTATDALADYNAGVGVYHTASSDVLVYHFDDTTGSAAMSSGTANYCDGAITQAHTGQPPPFGYQYKLTADGRVYQWSGTTQWALIGGVKSHKASLVLNTTVSVPDISYVAIDWTTSTRQLTGFTWEAVQPTRIYCTRTMNCRVDAMISYNTASSGARYMALFKNGSWFAWLGCIPPATASYTKFHGCLPALLCPMTAGDYFELVAYHTGGTGISAQATETWIVIEQDQT